MKHINSLHKWVLPVVILILLSSCERDTLLFPEQVKGEEVTVGTRPPARPNDITVFSDYNRRMEWYWPLVSDRVEKAVITYTENGEELSYEISNFEEPFIFDVIEQRAYQFKVVFFTQDGITSKESIVSATPIDYEANLILQSVTSYEAENGKVGFSFVAPPTGHEHEYIFEYSIDGLPKSYSIKSRNVSVRLEIPGFHDETLLNDFKISIRNDLLDYITEPRIVQQRAGVLNVKSIAQTIIFAKNGNEGVLFWKNTTGEPVNVAVSYIDGGITKSAEAVNNADVYGTLVFPVTNNNVVASIVLSDQSGANLPWEQSIIPEAQILNTSGWVGSASSVEPNEGVGQGQPASVIDGNLETFWHSNWSSGSNYPHWVAFNFGAERIISKVELIRRHNNSTGGFNLFDVEVSDNGISWRKIAVDLNFDSTTPPAWQSFDIPPTMTRHIRLFIKTRSPLNTGNYAHFAELKVHGFN